MKIINIFEHGFLPVGENGFTENHFNLLEKYIEGQKLKKQKTNLFESSREKGKNGIRFKQYVGVVVVKDLTIYVLPKADKEKEGANEDLWRNRLTYMLSQVYKLNVQTTAPTNLQWRPNVLLNIFLKKFLEEVAVLLNRGLIKTYQKTEGNRNALKGKLMFNKQMVVNCTHQEQFYVRYTTYDYNHILNRIIRQALLAIQDITNSSDIKGRATSMLFNFPELEEIPVIPELFSRLVYDRKSEDYRNAVKLAEMILLNYSPDLHHGSNHVWTMMFDMNKLWEEFIFISLRRQLNESDVTAQSSRFLWRSDNNKKAIKADIIIKKKQNNEEKTFVLDTKWKMPRYDGKIVPSDGDLHQMYVYLHEYGDVNKVALLYPGEEEKNIYGFFENDNKSCDMIFLPCKVFENNNSTNESQCWQKEIVSRVEVWLNNQ